MNHTGSFVAIWMGSWLLLVLLFSLAWPALRNQLARLHPANASLLALVAGSMPLTASLLSTLLLFNPDSRLAWIRPHCHGDCGSHAPLLDSTLLASIGLLLAALVIGHLLLRLTQALHRTRLLRRQFDQLGQRLKDPSHRILESDIAMVFTLGWLRPRVYFSRALFDQCSAQEVDIILRHERAHQQRRDNLLMLMARLTVMIAPRRLTQRWLQDLQLFCEQACDAVAAQHHNPCEVAETLIRVKRLLLDNPAPGLAHTQSFGGSELEMRVCSLLNEASCYQLSRVQLGCIIALLLTLTLLLAEPLHHAAEWLFWHLPAW